MPPRLWRSIFEMLIWDVHKFPYTAKAVKDFGQNISC